MAWEDHRATPVAGLMHKPRTCAAPTRPAGGPGGLAALTLSVAPLWTTSLYSLVEAGKQSSNVGLWRKRRSSACGPRRRVRARI